MAENTSYVSYNFGYDVYDTGLTVTGRELYEGDNKIYIDLEIYTDHVTSSSKGTSGVLAWELIICDGDDNQIGHAENASNPTGVLADGGPSAEISYESDLACCKITATANTSTSKIGKIIARCIIIDNRTAVYQCGDMVLTQFTVKPRGIKVTYNAGDYGVSAVTKTITPSSSSQITVEAANLIEPINDAYSYTKWVVNTRSVIEGDPEYVTAGQTIKLTTWSDLSLTPYWGGYASIKYDKNDSDASGSQGETKSEWFAIGTTVNLTVAEFAMTAPEGYGFKTWYTGRQGYITYKAPGEVISMTPGNTVTLYAKYQYTVKITYQPGYGTGADYTYTSTYDKGTSATELVASWALLADHGFVAPSDGTFKCWRAGTTDYGGVDGIADIPVSQNYTLTLVAIYTATTTVEYWADNVGKTEAVYTETKTAEYKTELTYKLLPPEDTGIVLDGDYAKATLLYYKIAVGGNFFPDEYEKNETITLTPPPKTVIVHMVYTCNCKIVVTLGSGYLNPNAGTSLFQIIADKNSDEWNCEVASDNSSANYFLKTDDATTSLSLPTLSECAYTVLRDNWYFNGFSITEVKGKVDESTTVEAIYGQYKITYKPANNVKAPDNIVGANKTVTLETDLKRTYESEGCKLKGWVWEKDVYDNIYANKELLELIGTDLAGERVAYDGITPLTSVDLPKFAPGYGNDWDKERTLYGVWYQYAHIVKWGQDE